MIRATITPHVDLEIAVGVRVPEDVLLPFAAWPGDGGAIELPECTVVRHVEPRPAPTFTKADAPRAPGTPRDFAVPPLAPTVGTPLAPETFVRWLVERLPRHGAVDPLDPSCPAFKRVIEAARKGLATDRGVNPGANVDTSWATLAVNVDNVVRRCALPPDVAFSVLRPTTRIADDELRSAVAAARADGHSYPGTVRDEIVEAHALEVDAAKRERERAAADAAREAEPVEVDLAAEGLCEFTSLDPNPFGARRFFLAGGLPIGDATIAVPFLASDGGGAAVACAMTRVRSTGTVTMTRAERRAALGALPDEIAGALLKARARETGGRRYAASDFQGDARSVEGLAALLAFRARAASLVHALGSHRTHSALAAYTHGVLMTLPVAFGGAVSLPNAIDSVQETLRAYVRSALGGRTLVYDQNNNQRKEDVPTEGRWPMHLMRSEAVPREMLAALANGSAWQWGELLLPPSPEDERRLRARLDPGAFERVIAEAVGDAKEARWQAVVDRLFAESLIGSPRPSVEQIRRISRVLERMGFVQGEGADPEGRRCRVWRRQ